MLSRSEVRPGQLRYFYIMACVAGPFGAETAGLCPWTLVGWGLTRGSSAQHCSSGIRARFHGRVAPVVCRNHKGCLLLARGFNWMNIFVFQAEVAPWCSCRAQQPPCEPALGGTDLAHGAGAAPGQQGLQGMFHTGAHQLTSFAGLTPTPNN